MTNFTEDGAKVENFFTKLLAARSPPRIYATALTCAYVKVSQGMAHLVVISPALGFELFSKQGTQ
jgi:hypothetical protein